MYLHSKEEVELKKKKKIVKVAEKIDNMSPVFFFFIHSKQEVELKKKKKIFK